MTTRILRIGGLATLLGLTALPAANAQNSVGNAISGTAGGQGSTGNATAPSLRGTGQANPRETTGSTGQRARPANGADNVIPGEIDRAPNADVRAPRAGGMMGANSAAYQEQAVIGHAVAMAIEASGLKACAEMAGAQPIDQAQAQNDREGGARKDPAEQLMMHARQGFQDSQVLLGSAGGDVVGRDNLQPATDRNPRDRRMYEAAGGYISTLASLSGMEYGRPGANPDRAEASQKTKPMSPQDKATVALINHSVKEVIDGSHILHASAGGMQGGSSRGVDALTRHGRQMRTNGTQTLMRLASNQQPADQQAEGATVMMLAQRGRELVEAISTPTAGGGQTTRDAASRHDGAPPTDLNNRDDEGAANTAPGARLPARNNQEAAPAQEEAPAGQRPGTDKAAGGSILNGTGSSSTGKDSPR
jgi:hypothetical protein